MNEGEIYLKITRKRLNEEHGWSLNLPDLIKVFDAARFASVMLGGDEWCEYLHSFDTSVRRDK